MISRLNLEAIAEPNWIEKRVSELDDFDPSALISKDVLLDFFKRFEVSNQNVSKKYLDQKELFTEQSKTYNYFNPEDDKQALAAMTRFLSISLF